MMDELQREFGAQLIATGRVRLERAAEVLQSSTGGVSLRGEMHALAGEAAMLGFEALAAAARRAEEAARRWGAGDPGAQATCADLVRAVDAELAKLAPPP